MRTFMRASLIGSFLAALAVATGCEDTPLAPGADSTMTVVASPQTLVFQPADSTLNSTISAVILDESGSPSTGVAVLFSTTSGSLASGGGVRETDGTGRASDTLTVPRDGPATVTITATAGTLTETVALTKTTSATNNPPTPRIVVSPPFEQIVNQPIALSGATSSDPDAADSIASYAWRVTSPSAPDATGSGVSLTLPGYPAPQTLSINLTVTDSRGLTGTTSSNYRVTTTRTCADNTAPVANIAGGSTQSRNGTVSSTIPFALDGSGSSDAETTIQVYRWNCGNGTTPSGTGANVTCNYVVEASPHTYTATLEVEDQGFGLPELECQKTSPEVQVSIIIGPNPSL